MAARVVMPSVGMYTVEGKVTAWRSAPGSAVEAGQPLVEFETEKANFEIESPAAGTFHALVTIGATLQVEGLIGLVLAPGEDLAAALAAAGVATGAAPPALDAAPAPSAPRARELPANDAERSPASPLARRLAAELGVKLGGVTGSGPGGRIVEADVRAAAARGAAARDAEPSSAPPAVVAIPWRVRERLPLTGARRTIAERLRRSQSTAVALTLTREVNAALLVAARKALSERLGAAVPWDALFIRLFADALAERGELNALIVGDEIVRLDEIHIAFAVSLDGALVTPVVRDADRRTLGEVADAVRALGARARAGNLQPDDVAGGTATITNLGGHGVDAFTPVLNPPQSAILGIGRITERAVVENGALVARPTSVLSLTFDHRVADGAPAADLLAAIADRMSDAAYLDRFA